LPASLLTPLQQQVLEAFFRREQRFFLSGGAALAGFHLAHRRTHDLDLFTTADVIEDGEQALALTADELGATVEKIQTTPAFRRRIVRRREEAVVIDLIHERVPQGPLPKERIGNIRVDPPQEILANKVCALLSRSELRDALDAGADDFITKPLDPRVHGHRRVWAQAHRGEQREKCEALSHRGRARPRHPRRAPARRRRRHLAQGPARSGNATAGAVRVGVPQDRAQPAALKEECGVEDFLAKPTSAPALLAKVERGLKTALEQLRSSPRDSGLQGVARRRAHQIAGTAGSFGFDQIGDSCATLEDALARLQAGFDFAPVAAALDSLRKATA
jgi:CheY-like chemotaxis protein